MLSKSVSNIYCLLKHLEIYAYSNNRVLVLLIPWVEREYVLLLFSELTFMPELGCRLRELDNFLCAVLSLKKFR